MMWVYILQSVRHPRRHYRGLTSDLDQRLAEHNAGSVASTARFRPWKIIIAIRFENDQRAKSFEKYLKSGSGHAFSRRHFY